MARMSEQSSSESESTATPTPEDEGGEDDREPTLRLSEESGEEEEVSLQRKGGSWWSSQCLLPPTQCGHACPGAPFHRLMWFPPPNVVMLAPLPSPSVVMLITVHNLIPFSPPLPPPSPAGTDPRPPCNVRTEPVCVGGRHICRYPCVPSAGEGGVPTDTTYECPPPFSHTLQQPCHWKEENSLYTSQQQSVNFHRSKVVSLPPIHCSACFPFPSPKSSWPENSEGGRRGLQQPLVHLPPAVPLTHGLQPTHCLPWGRPSSATNWRGLHIAQLALTQASPGF